MADTQIGSKEALAKLLVVVAQFLPGACESVSNARLANAQRRLVNDAREPILDTIASVNDTMKSQIVLNVIRAKATVEELAILERVGASATLRDQIEAWAAVANADTVRSVASEITNMARSVGAGAEAVGRSAESAAAGLNGISQASQAVAHDIHGVRVMSNSLLHRFDLYGGLLSASAAGLVHEARQGVGVLTEMSEHLGNHNSILTSGSGGPNGHAQHVYDFVQMRVEEAEDESRRAAEASDHMFFLYHPDTDWWPAFSRLVRASPLPEQFCAKSDDLDKLCQIMQHVREMLDQSGHDGRRPAAKKVVFHLLTPSWYRICIQEPLHFPGNLQPLRIEGTKHKGKPLVEFNLPYAPSGMLHGVTNAIDPNGYNTRAGVVALSVALPATGVNVACLALGMGVGAITGLGALVGVPIWWGTATPAVLLTVEKIGTTIYDAMKENPPRILGSNQTFHP